MGWYTYKLSSISYWMHGIYLEISFIFVKLYYNTLVSKEYINFHTSPAILVLHLSNNNILLYMNSRDVVLRVLCLFMLIWISYHFPSLWGFSLNDSWSFLIYALQHFLKASLFGKFGKIIWGKKHGLPNLFYIHFHINIL